MFYSREILDDFKFTRHSSNIIQNFKYILNNKKANFLNRYSNTKKEKRDDFLRQLLIEIAHKELFSNSSKKLALDQYYNQIKQTIENKKEKKFPLYNKFKPNLFSDNVILNLIKIYNDENKWKDEIKTIIHNIKKVQDSNNLEQKKVILDSINKLIKINLVNDSKDTQYCPICNYNDLPTLSNERINEIKSWVYITDTLVDNELEFKNQINLLIQDFTFVFRTCKSFLPFFPSDGDLDLPLKETKTVAREIIDKLYNSFRKIDYILNMIDYNNKYLFDIIKDIDTINLSETSQEIKTNCQSYLEFINESQIYTQVFSKIEQLFDFSLDEDQTYKKMIDWIHCYNNFDLLKKEIEWEIAKKMTQDELKTMRQELIELRHSMLEFKRSSFNQEISSIWNELRADQYSNFKSLHIPKPKGRGFPIEINVIANLDDGTEEKEIDALRIFSESQLNALGIAAFITRSKIMGHKFMIFDDPVQSMDEEHFKTFASKVIRKLLNEDFQIIIFTHSDQFAREISNHYWDYNDYTTMTVYHSKRKGCRVEEGNRKVSERLNKSKKLSEEGNLSEAWKYIRLAIERMYIVINLKYVTKFNPSSWNGQTADYIWKQGIEKIVDMYKPEMKQRLKSILSMTASGAHDKPPNGETDLYNAIKDIKSLLTTLKISD